MKGLDMEGAFYAKAAAYLGAAIAIGVGSIGPAIGQGLIGTKATESVGKYPESAGVIRTTMMIAMAIVESAAIYAFIIALLLVILNT
jgi:F-type H+-transporting ATPase subunit c